MIYTIGDLHLPLGINKPMDIFGDGWTDYVLRLENNWKNAIRDEDTVVIPGDFSWATYIDEAQRDFEWLEKLPGKKIILKGNHDYWWTTMNKLNEYIHNNNYKTIAFLHNNAFLAEGISICGTRGWIYPGFPGYSGDDEKYFAREVARLEASLKLAENDNIYVFTHYPPASRKGEINAFIEMMMKYNVKKCFYGHLHSGSHVNRIPDKIEGIEFRLISSDFLRFSPRCVNGGSIV